MEMEEELIYLNALNRVSCLGPVRIEALRQCFGSPREAWEAAPEELGRVAELKGHAGRFVSERRGIDPRKEWHRLQKLKIRCLSPRSPEYPFLLKQISRPPPLLYCSGRWRELDHPGVAIVGSRRCTFYGKEVAGRLAGELADAGLVVVSGMALGIDTAAHEGALERKAPSVAVLGCSVERCYPPGNRSLRDRLIREGAVISEFPLDTLPLPPHFPRRNRIISGLTLGTIVVEAPERSGALITALYALEQNRDVFAVPGNIGSPYSRGCHRLIKEGARLVESGEDILEELGLTVPGGAAAEAAATEGRERGIALDELERKLFQLIAHQPLHIDEIVSRSGEEAARAGAGLLGLELKGLIRQLPGKYFVRT